MSVRISDVIVPEVFGPYALQESIRLNRLIASGAIAVDPEIEGFLRGGGLTFQLPSWQDVPDDDDRVPTDDPTNVIPRDGSGSNPNLHRKLSASQETAVRINRNQSWMVNALATQLAGDDPMKALGTFVNNYWRTKEQKILLDILKGVFADNTANDSGDMTYDIKGGGYVAGVTDISQAAFNNALLTMGDAMNFPSVVLMHSVPFTTLKNKNLIDTVPDTLNPGQNISKMAGTDNVVIVDDGMPASAGIYETFILGQGSVRYGTIAPPEAVEFSREPQAGYGAGADIMWNRRVFCLHPTGFSYIGTAPSGGPSIGTGSNNFGAAGSWNRVYPFRKQIKIARLVTRES